MVKEHLRLKDQLVDREGPGRNADKTYLDHPKDAREPDLAKMKSESRRNVQLWVGVVNVVKAPEKRCAVIGEVPVVEGQIHEQKTGRQLKPSWKGEKVDKTKGLVSGPAERPLGCRLDQSNGCEEGKSRNGNIHQKASDQ